MEFLYLSLVIPAFNEAQGITSGLARLRRYLEEQSWEWEVIVVDDGSRDETANRVSDVTKRDRHIRLVRNEMNRGKGHAVRTGVLTARGCYVGFMDADLSTDLEAMARAVALLEDGADVVCGSRRLAGSRILIPQPWTRRLASNVLRVIAATALDLKGVSDTQCGFKFFRAPVARDLFSLQLVNGFLFDVEILGMARRRGYAIAEVPVVWTNRLGSRVRVLSLGFQTLQELPRIRQRVSHLHPQPHANRGIHAADHLDQIT